MFSARDKKLPAVNAVKYLCTSAAREVCPKQCTSATPATQVRDTKKFQNNNFITGKPADLSTMKSPSS